MLIVNYVRPQNCVTVDFPHTQDKMPTTQHYSFKPVLFGNAFVSETAYICNYLMFKNRIIQHSLVAGSDLLFACFLGSV